MSHTKSTAASGENHENKSKSVSEMPVETNAINADVRKGFSLEENVDKHIFNPLLSELEQSLEETTKQLESLNLKMKEERAEKAKKEHTQHIPAVLQGSGQDPAVIMKHLEDLILHDDAEDHHHHSVHHRSGFIRHQTDQSKLAVLGHSLAAYLNALDSSHLSKLSARIMSDTTLWMSKLFRFFESAAYFHAECREGLVRVFRLVLYKRYPKFAQEGYEALYTRPPVIYVSEAGRMGLGQHLCSQVGLPSSCVCTIKCNTSESEYRMDVDLLEKQIQEHVESGKVPLMIIGNAGTPFVGHVDRLQRLQELAAKHDIWLHLEGNSLATLALVPVPNTIESASTCDSMTLSLGQWLGLPPLPLVTLYRPADPALVHAVGLSPHSPQLRLTALPAWLCLQSMGYDGISHIIRHSCELAGMLQTTLQKISAIQMIGQSGGGKGGSTSPAGPVQTFTSFKDILAKAATALLMFEHVRPTTVFRFCQERQQAASGGPGARNTAPYAGGEGAPQETDQEDEEDEAYRKNYFDALNSWFGQMLQRENHHVKIEMVDMEVEGVCIRYAPLENAQLYGTTSEHMKTFVESVVAKVTILTATSAQRDVFQRTCCKYPSLVLVPVYNWAGLGAVQYVPEEYQERLDDLTDKDKRELNKLNLELVHQLKTNDAAFTAGDTQDGLTCVRFGMVTEETDTQELLEMVATLGREVEESSKYIETMAEVVKQGIEAASKDLAKENDDKLVQEGVLRQVPLVGSFINWWSPPPKEHGIKGRSFDLPSGTVQSTESIYRYHMQVKRQAAQAAAAAASAGAGGDTGSLTANHQEPATPATPAKDEVFLPSQAGNGTGPPASPPAASSPATGPPASPPVAAQ